MKQVRNVVAGVVFAAAIAFTLSNCRSGSLAQPTTSEKKDSPRYPWPFAEKPKPTIDQLAVQDVHGGLSTIQPSHTHTRDYFLLADFLFWNAQEDGLDFADKAIRKDNLDYKGKNIEPDFDRWAPGARLGLGFFFGWDDQWNFGLTWTYFHNKATEHAHTSDPFLMFPTWGGGSGIQGTTSPFKIPAITGNHVLAASADWRLNYNIFDLEIGRNYFISKAIAFRPRVGIRGSSIDQHYDVHYHSLYQDLSFPFSHEGSSSMKATNDSWGIGPRLGCDLSWHFTEHWGLVGSLSGSLLYGRFDVEQKYDGFMIEENLLAFPITTSLVPLLNKNKFHKNLVQPNLDTSLGIEWETRARKNKNHVSIGLFYELSYWFRQNQLVRTTTNGLFQTQSQFFASTPFFGIEQSQYERELGDLSLQGVTLKMRVDF